VIGGGLFGTSIAYQLCRGGAGRVVLIERDGLGRGDSGRTFGMVRRHYSNAVTALLAMRGSHTIMHWDDEVGVGASGYVETGYLLSVPEPLADAGRANVARLAALGLETTFVSPAEIAEIEPLLALDGIAGAAYEPDGGFADAAKMCLG
jgi:sarcosine oxidase, subunit beta